MRAEPRVYPAGDDARVRRALELLARRFPRGRPSEAVVRRVYLDTFDWRLHRAGHALSFEHQGASGAMWLVWTSRDGRPLRRLRAGGKPAFAADLPPGPFRDALARVTGVRRLLARVETRGRERTIPMLDERSKTVARVVLSSGQAGRPGDDRSGVELAPVARVVPLRGHEREFEAVTALLEGEAGLARDDRGELDRAATAVGVRPRDYSGKVDVELEPRMRADEAARRIHRRLLETIEANEPGVRDDLDPEFLHDFRVAVRRTRSALAQIREVFDPAARARWAAEFRWLGRLTGPKRDLDVSLEKLPGYAALLPEDDRQALGPLGAFLRRQQAAARLELVAGLDSARYRGLIDGWRAFLEPPHAAPPGGDGVPPDAARPAIELARERIWRASKKLRRRGRAIEPDSPAERLHRLRIDAKKLRYLLEFFNSLWDAHELQPLVRRLKKLQNTLGTFNDLHVQRTELRALAQRLAGGGEAAAPTLLAMGRLLERLAERQRDERQRFAARFARFDSRSGREHVRALFRPGDSARR